MAIFHLSCGAVSRGQGQSAVAAAAYRSRSELEDERTGDRHDYSKAAGLQFEGIYAPANAPEWAKDRAQLWNRVEAAETRKNARPARDLVLALPHELTAEQNRRLVQDFVREQFVRKGLVADVAIHAPHRHGDDRNTHAHILLTTRTLDGKGFAKGKLRELNSKAQLQGWREAWERLANRHLERAGQEARIDHRTLAEQGVERAATVHLGKHAAALERGGISTAQGEHNRFVQAVQHERLFEALDLARPGPETGRPEAEALPGAELHRPEPEATHGPENRPSVPYWEQRPTDTPEAGPDLGRGPDFEQQLADSHAYREDLTTGRPSRSPDRGNDDTGRAIGEGLRDIERGTAQLAGVAGKAAGAVLDAAIGLLDGLLGNTGNTRPPASAKGKPPPEKEPSGPRDRIKEAKAQIAARPPAVPDKEREQDRGRSRFEARPFSRFLEGVADQWAVGWAIKARTQLLDYAARTGADVLTELAHLNAVITGGYLLQGLTLTGKPRMEGGPA